MDNQLLAERLNYTRTTLRSLTLQELADLSGVAASTVQRYEKGLINKIKMPVVEAFARALCVNPRWLCGDDAPMLPPAPERDPHIVPGFFSLMDLAETTYTDVDINGLFRITNGTETLALSLEDITEIVSECREFAKNSVLEHHYRRKKLRLATSDINAKTL